MTTVRDLIGARLAACLAPLVDTDGFEIDPDGDPSIFPGLALFDHGDQLLEREYAIERRAANYSLEGYLDRSGGSDGAAARNDLHARAVAAIMADDTLGNTVELVEMGDLRKLTARFSSVGRLSFVQDFTVQFTTQRANPALPA